MYCNRTQCVWSLVKKIPETKKDKWRRLCNNDVPVQGGIGCWSRITPTGTTQKAETEDGWFHFHSLPPSPFHFFSLSFHSIPIQVQWLCSLHPFLQPIPFQTLYILPFPILASSSLLMFCKVIPFPFSL